MVGQAKLIAEPWDVGQADSYDLGRFPAQWREWNGRYRDSMRDFWRSKDVGVAEFATRFSGSSDLYGGARRRPTASVNLITVHDGFTLRDLVSYDSKHNEANGEDNRDGTRRQPVMELRRRGSDRRPGGQRAAGPPGHARCCRTLLLSFGLPMLLGGDELGRTQRRQQQRLLPGQRDLLVRLGSAPTAGCAATSSGCSRCAARTRCSAASGT